MRDPYRPLVSPSYEEEELWMALDWAIEEAMRDPGLAWAMIWQVAVDAQLLGYIEIRDAAEAALQVLS